MQQMSVFCAAHWRRRSSMRCQPPAGNSQVPCEAQGAHIRQEGVPTLLGVYVPPQVILWGVCPSAFDYKDLDPLPCASPCICWALLWDSQQQSTIHALPLSCHAQCVAGPAVTCCPHDCVLQVRYESRQRLAEARPRVKGQFVKAIKA